ncbi:MAG: molybdopterin-dependent oxidoreductase [Anaerolineales bacterium]|nr:molybdopterin-dependent oxidoreductase [Anaerolineales bacterium]
MSAAGESSTRNLVRQGLVAKIKLGMTPGWSHRSDAQHLLLGRAHTEYGVNITRAAGYSTGPYFVPNVHADCSVSAYEPPHRRAMRGFGMPEIHWAIEQHIDRPLRSASTGECGGRTGSQGWPGNRDRHDHMHPTGLSQ